MAEHLTPSDRPLPALRSPALSPVRIPGLLRRFCSMVYEALLLAAVLFLAGFLFVGFTHYSGSGPLRPIFQLYLFLVIGAYFLWFWLHGGQTAAMKAWRLRLVSADGGPVRFSRALLRLVLAWLGLAFAGIGFLWAFFDRDRQFLHDRLAGTRIVLVAQ